MTTSALRRQVKNIVHNYSEAEIKVREATSNDPWGPPSSLMSEIADLTFNTVAFAEVMGMIWRRLNDSGKNWRHVYKALTLLDYLIKTGSEKVTHQCRENLYTIQTLKDFQYVDRDGKDQGINIREKVKQVMALLKDEERLKQERAHALQTKERMALEGMGSGSHQLSYGRRASPYGDDYGRTRGSPSSFNSSSSSPRFASDLEQARPQTTGEEELQLQLALAMSREEAEKVAGPRGAHVAGREGCRSAGPCPSHSHGSLLLSDLKPKAEPAASAWAGGADPWVPLPAAEPLSQPPASSQQPSAGPWDFPAAASSSSSSSDPWGKTPLPAGFSSADPWAKASPPAQAPDGPVGRTAVSAGRCPQPTRSPCSLAELDPFEELFPGAKQNGTKSFDLASLADSLPESCKERKDCKTPEAFLGPAASSLVNLDSLVAPPQATKTRNPFLSGRSLAAGRWDGRS
uniref:Epsin 3 n=1 Tax=Nothoprocta perdicaria TaxID=30464 RepID=A0A8C6Z035_NOTPE